MDRVDLSKYVPRFIYNNGILNKIYNSQEEQLTNLRSQIEDLQNQFYIDTATWGLDLWEKEYGIAKNENYTLEERRSLIKAKKRGQGVITKGLIRNICQSWAGCDVDVVENTAPYTFKLIFKFSKGMPKNLDALLDVIGDIKPAHLQMDLEMQSLTHDYINIRSAMLCGEEMHVFPYQITNIESVGKLNIALGNTQNAEIINVKPIRKG